MAKKNEDRILTRHPESKKGVNILKSKYDIIKEEILEVIQNEGEISFNSLTHAVNKNLEGRFDGKTTWYVVTVKLDLEARGLIERVPGESPQKLRIKGP